MAIGAGVAVVSYVACTFLKPAFGYDDSLDVFGVHALGGAWGALASGIFATTLGADIESNAQQIMVQLKGIGFVIVFAPLATAVREGDADAALDLLRSGTLSNVHFHEGLADPLDAHRDALLAHWRALAHAETPADALAQSTRLRLLTAVREGPGAHARSTPASNACCSIQAPARRAADTDISMASC